MFFLIVRIGVLSKNYAAKRLYLNKLPFAVYKDIRFYNWHPWKNVHLCFLRTIGKPNMTLEEEAAKLFYDFKSVIATGCDVFYFFNTICNYSPESYSKCLELLYQGRVNEVKRLMSLTSE